MAGAQVVTWEIGRNDYFIARMTYQARGCGGPDNQDCLRRAASAFKSNWDGIVREIEVLTNAQVTLLADRRSRGPYGLSGGADGAPGRTVIVRQDAGDLLFSSAEGRHPAGLFELFPHGLGRLRGRIPGLVQKCDAEVAPLRRRGAPDLQTHGGER